MDSRNFDIFGFVDVGSHVSSATVIRSCIVRRVLLSYLIANLELSSASINSSCVRLISVYKSGGITCDLLAQVFVTFDQQTSSINVDHSFTHQVVDPGDLLIVNIHGDPCSVDFNITGCITVSGEVIS